MNTFGELDLNYYLKKFEEDNIKFVPIGHTRDVNNERKNIEKYLSGIDNKKIEEFKKMNDSLPPMKDCCRMAILVPSRFESKRIITCLDALTNQDLTNYKNLYNQIEIIVLDNYHYDELPDDTEMVIKQYCESCKAGTKPPIHYLRKQFDAEDKRYGLCRARKTLTDFTLYRALQRKNYEKPLYITSGDADLTFVDKNIYKYVIETFDTKPEIDAIRGVQDRETKILSQNAYLFLERRSWNFAEIMYSQLRYRPEFYKYSNFTWNRVVTGGWHTYFTADVYAIINGYSDTIRFLEDIDIGNRISVLRGNYNYSANKFDYKTLSIAPTSLRADSSPSRFVMALANKADPYSHDKDYDVFFSKESEIFVREYHMNKSLDIISKYRDVTKENKVDFDEILKRVFLNCREIMCEDKEAMRIFHRIMLVLGFSKYDYTINDNRLVIRSYDNFTDCLNNYRNKVG